MANIPGFESYSIDKFGTVTNNRTGRTLKPEVVGGYLRVDLRQNKTRLRELVHRLVILTFVGPIPPDKVVEHLDGCPTNNHVSNLKVSSQRDNLLRRKDHGTYPEGSKHWKSLLTDQDRNTILTSNESAPALAKRFNVTKGCVDQIRLRARKRDYNG